MDRRADEIRHEIDGVREDLGETLEAIGDRVAPQKVVARAKADLAEKVEDVKEKVSPARLARRGADAVRRGVRSAVGSDGSGNGNATAVLAARTVPTGAAGGTGTAAAVTHQARSIGRRAGSAASSVVDDVRDAPQAARRKAEGNPLAAGLLAFAGGFFAAALLPPSDTEKELTARARERIQPLLSDVVEAGKSAAGELQSTAVQSLERVKETAAEAAQDVKGEAETAVTRVKGQATGAAGEVAAEARTTAATVKQRARGSAGSVKDQARKEAGGVKAKARSAAGSATGPSSTGPAARRSRVTRAASPRGGRGPAR